MGSPAAIGIVTVSDRASRGEYEDLGGPAIEEWIGKALSSRWRPERRLTRIFHPLLAFPGGQWMEDVVPRTGRGKAREGLFSRLQAHLSLTPIVCQRAGAALLVQSSNIPFVQF